MVGVSEESVKGSSDGISVFVRFEPYSSMYSHEYFFEARAPPKVDRRLIVATAEAAYSWAVVVSVACGYAAVCDVFEVEVVVSRGE